MQYQALNLIIVGVAVCLYKLLSQKGIKSMVMFIMFMTLVAAVPLAIIATIISARQSLGNAMSFKLIGDEFNKAPNFKSTELELKKQTVDLSALTSFNCSETFPQFIADYIDDTFTQNHDAILDDMSTHHRYEYNSEQLPRLLSTQTQCDRDDDCMTVFNYDKPYSIQLDVEFKRDKTLFHCCDPMLTNPIEDVCNLTETMTDGVKYNQNPVLWERVTIDNKVVNIMQCGVKYLERTFSSVFWTLNPFKIDQWPFFMSEKFIPSDFF